MSKTELMKLVYTDPERSIFLEAWADAVAYDVVNKEPILVFARFGGYPEIIRGISDAIHGGSTVSLFAGSDSIQLTGVHRQYVRNLKPDSIYTEAVLSLKNLPETKLTIKKTAAENRDTQESLTDNKKDYKKESQELLIPRCSYLITETDNRHQLFQKLDEVTSVPLLVDFQDYFIDELIKRGILTKLQVYSAIEQFEVWKLDMSNDEQKIKDVINDGIRSQTISIPGAEGTDVFKDIDTVGKYLKHFGVQIGEKLKNQFNPLYDPQKEFLSLETLAANASIRQKAGYNLFDAQLAIVEALKRELDSKSTAMLIAECGSGKCATRF